MDVNRMDDEQTQMNKAGVFRDGELNWERFDISYTLSVRNVGEKNKDAQIQFVLERYNTYKERSLPLVCFNIPSTLVENFLERVKNPPSPTED